jgi:SAM-dependent methyltransferase
VWRSETRRVVGSFDAVADLYRDRFVDELDRKPFDREFLAGAASRIRSTGLDAPVLEVGAGPGHIGRFFAEHGVRVVTSDASQGQLAQARGLRPLAPIVACDLANLPVRAGSLAGILGFYCLIYTPPEHLGAVFAEWQRALVPGGLAVIALQAGAGTIHHSEWNERVVDLTVVLRDPDDVRSRITAGGFAVEQLVVRAPYEDEGTERMYVVARAQPC